MSRNEEAIDSIHMIGYCPKCDTSIMSGMTMCDSCGWKVVNSEVVPVWTSTPSKKSIDIRETECKWGFDTCVFCGHKVSFTGKKDRKAKLWGHYMAVHPNASREKMRWELDNHAWNCSNEECRRQVKPQELVEGKHIVCGYRIAKDYICWQLAMIE